VNILNKHSRTADKVGHPAGGLGELLTTPRRKKVLCYEAFTIAMSWDCSFGRPLGRPRRRCEDNIKMYLQEVGSS
jgi:hypothetical protein